MPDWYARALAVLLAKHPAWGPLMMIALPPVQWQMKFNSMENGEQSLKVAWVFCGSAASVLISRQL